MVALLSVQMVMEDMFRSASHPGVPLAAALDYHPFTQMLLSSMTGSVKTVVDAYKTQTFIPVNNKDANSCYLCNLYILFHF